MATMKNIIEDPGTSTIIGHHNRVAVTSKGERSFLKVSPNNPNLLATQTALFKHNFNDDDESIINRVYFRYQFDNDAVQFITIPLSALWSVCHSIIIKNGEETMLSITDKMTKIYYHRNYLMYKDERNFLANRAGANHFTAPSLTSTTTVLTGSTPTAYFISDLDEIFNDFFRGLSTKFLKNFSVEYTMMGSISQALDSFYVGLQDPSVVNLAYLTIKNISLNFDMTKYPKSSLLYKNNVISVPFYRLHRKQYSVASQAETELELVLNTEFTLSKSINAFYFYLSKTTPSISNNYTIFENSNIIKRFELLYGRDSKILLESPEEIAAYTSHYLKQKGIERNETHQSNVNTDFTLALMIPLASDLRPVSDSTEHFTGINNYNTQYNIKLTINTAGHDAAFDILNIVCEAGSVITLSKQKGVEQIFY